jgi:hypothetical protein
MPKEADVYNGGMERENYTSYADGEAEKGLKKKIRQICNVCKQRKRVTTHFRCRRHDNCHEGSEGIVRIQVSDGWTSRQHARRSKGTN